MLLGGGGDGFSNGVVFGESITIPGWGQGENAAQARLCTQQCLKWLSDLPEIMQPVSGWPGLCNSKAWTLSPLPSLGRRGPDLSDSHTQGRTSVHFKVELKW